MSKGRIRRVSIFALLLVALSAAPALAGPAAPWEGAWKAACGLFAPWLRPEALKRPASAKRAVTIGPDGVSNEAAADGQPAGEGSTPVPVSSS